MRARTKLLGAILLLTSSASGAPVSGEWSALERTSTADWSHELERHVLALALPALPLSAAAGPQTSPRYASHQVPVLESVLFACGWLIEEPSAADRAVLELLGSLVANQPRSVLSRQLVERGLARAVEARLVDHDGRALFAIFVLGSPIAQQTNLGDVVDAAMLALSISGPTAVDLGQVSSAGTAGESAGITPEDVRRVVIRQLSPQRRSVVELLPRHAPDPALSVKPRKESAQTATAARGSTGRPTAVPREAAQGRGQAVLHATVERGDTLIGIARRHKVRVSELAARNKIDPARPIRVGQKLIVPERARGSEPRVRNGAVAKSQSKPTLARLRNPQKPRSP